jgi:tetratricopeptide (TPR) repeat protein
LKDAAVAAGYPEVAAFALETIVEGNPKDTKALHALGGYYYENGLSDKAVDIYNRIVELNPADLIAIKRGKDAAARDSMKSGGWETAKDYRDLIKDKDVAISLEQQNRVVKSEEMIDQQIAELYERSEKEPENVDVARRIAALFEQKGELESAIWWYSRASELAKNTDPVLSRKVSDLSLKMVENDIKAREEWLASAPDHEEAPRVQSELDELKKQRDSMLIDEARKRVERNPTDLQLRYELGEQLVDAGQFTEAIPELQQARKNPNARLKAMNLLGDCYGCGRGDHSDGRFEEEHRLQAGAGLRKNGPPRRIAQLHEADLRDRLRL